MFFRKKELEEFLTRIEKRFEILEEKFQKQETSATDKQLEEMCQQIGGLKTAVQKHDMAIEDLLEEWEEKSSDEEDIKKRFRQSEQTEQELLGLFEAYYDQFFSLKRFAQTDNGALASQIELMEKTLEQVRQKCGINMVGEHGEAVDYELHEVVEAIDTTNPNQDKTVAEIYRQGYIYKGTIRKKAQVSAYRMNKNS